MMKAGSAGLARTWSTGPNLLLKVSSKPRSPVATSDSACAIIAWPSVARFAQRITEATASLAVTGEPSWNFMPGRSVKLHFMPSGLTVHLSIICGFGSSLLSSAKSTS